MCSWRPPCAQKEETRDPRNSIVQERKSRDRVPYLESAGLQLKPCQVPPRCQRDGYSNCWNVLKASSSDVLAQCPLSGPEKQRGGKVENIVHLLFFFFFLNSARYSKREILKSSTNIFKHLLCARHEMAKEEEAIKKSRISSLLMGSSQFSGRSP